MIARFFGGNFLEKLEQYSGDFLMEFRQNSRSIVDVICERLNRHFAADSVALTALCLVRVSVAPDSKFITDPDVVVFGPDEIQDNPPPPSWQFTGDGYALSFIGMLNGLHGDLDRAISATVCRNSGRILYFMPIKKPKGNEVVV